MPQHTLPRRHWPEPASPWPPAAGPLADPEGLGGALEVAGLDPEDHAVAAGAGADGVGGRDVDLRRRQPPQHLGDRADAVVALDEEPLLGALQLPLAGRGRGPEGGWIGGGGGQLRTLAFWETPGGQQGGPRPPALAQQA